MGQLIHLRKLLRQAASQVNDAHGDLARSRSTNAREFHHLKLQACIFQYDLCLAMVSFLATEPTGLAARLAIKHVLLCLFEYNRIHGALTKRVTSLAAAIAVNVDPSTMKAQRKKWIAEFRKLDQWGPVRNTAAGHYSANTSEQVSALVAIDPDEVMLVSIAFMHLNMEWLRMLQTVGKGN